MKRLCLKGKNTGSWQSLCVIIGLYHLPGFIVKQTAFGPSLGCSELDGYVSDVRNLCCLQTWISIWILIFFYLSSSLLLIATHESFVSAYNSYQVPQEHKNIHSNKHYCNCHLFMMCRGICVQDCQLFICTKSDTLLQGSQFFIKLSSPWVSSVKSRQAQCPTRTWWSADCCTEKTQDQG